MTNKMAEITDKIEWETLEEEFTCGYCGDLFVEPKTLSCSHTFCAKCIDDNFLQVRPMIYPMIYLPGGRISSKKFICFMCKASFSEKVVAKVPTNVSMESLISIVKKRRAYVKAINEKDEDASDLIVTCTQCEEDARATRWCLTCENAEICEECYKCHCRLKIFKSHRVIELEKFIESPSFVLNCRPYCRMHKTQPLERHCKTCHVFMCQHCLDLQFCNGQLCTPHDYEAIDDAYEAKAQKIKEANLNLQATKQKVVEKLRHMKHVDQELNQKINEEVLWVQERFQEIRNLVNKHEKDLLLNLETILTVGKALLRKRSIILCQREKQLNHFKHFTSSILLPFRLQEVFMYSDWIPIKCQEEVKEDDDKECKTIALPVIFRGSLDLDDLTKKVLS